MIYVIYPDVDVWNFVLNDRIEGVITRPLNQYTSIFQQAIRKINCRFLSSPKLILGCILRRELSNLSSGDVLLVGDYTDVSLLHAIDKEVKKDVKKYLWLWNPLKGQVKSAFLRARDALGEKYKYATFDPNDAKTFGLDLHSQFFRMSLSFPVQPQLYDFYFIGYEKGRQKEIDLIKSLLKDYRCLFHVVHNKKEYINYEDSLLHASQSRCLVEIVQDGQSGLSLRPLEALALKKKLITNNSSIKDYDFYCPNNVFIVGERDWQDLFSFIDTPYCDCFSDISHYDVSTWLDSFKSVKQ